MKSKLKNALNDFSFEELKILQNDLNNGADEMKSAVWEKMQEMSNSEKFCATCFRELKTPKFSLAFGTKFKKKVSFCETDCMQYFILHLKEFEEEVKNI